MKRPILIMIVSILVAQIGGCAGGSRGTGTGMRVAPLAPDRRLTDPERDKDRDECLVPGWCKHSDGDGRHR